VPARRAIWKVPYITNMGICRVVDDEGR